ncbi:MAG: ABC transporter permease [Solirubrobacteraceae bacterium]|jgi:ABC-2 type transport system permease protein
MSAITLTLGRRRQVTRASAILHVYRAERRKLATQVATRVLALVCVLGPLAFAAILQSQTGAPADTIFGVWVHSSGYAISLVLLSFCGSWGFPVLAGVLAGDIFSSEDRYGTWKTVLTRSCGRDEVFIGKVLAAATFSVALTLLAAVATVVAGVVFVGDQSLVGLSGTLLSSGRCAALVAVSWLFSVLPVLAFTSLAVLFSVATRNGILGVLGPSLVGLAFQLLELVGTGVWVHTLLISSAFDGWHGLFTAHPFYGQLVLAIAVSLAWIAACLGAAWWILRRRDFAGAPIGRRQGWATPVRTVVALAAVLAVLTLSGNWGPNSVTSARLQASIEPTFESLTLLQQRELGRTVPPGTRLNILTNCLRRAGTRRGPGDDWVCTLNVLIPQPGAVPFQSTPVTYDISVKSNGCYKAEAPPTFVGQLLMKDAHGHNVVNPLFVIYGCFEP